MSDYYSSIFPQSTYRRTEAESQGREVRKMKLDLPNLAGESDAVKAELTQRIQTAASDVIEALGIEARVKPADRDRMLAKITKALGISE